jgi:hypothetical protein
VTCPARGLYGPDTMPVVIVLPSTAILTRLDSVCKIQMQLSWRKQMAPQSSPTVKRRRLAAELRHYRDAAGLTIDDVAERLEWSTAKISRIENSACTA